MTRETPRRVLLLTDGDWMHASSRIRGVAYIPLLEQRGYRVVWRSRVGAAPRSALDRVRFAVQKRWRRLRLSSLLAQPWDIVFVQRLVLSSKALALLRRRGTPVVYDFDDALYVDTPGQTGQRHATARMVEAAAEVIVASPELAPFCRAHGKEPTVIPTCVDTERIRPAEEPPGTFVVGWMGSSWTTSYLALLAEPLARLAREMSVRMLIVGADPRQVNLPGVDVEFVPWSHEAEAALLARMTVGVMPVPDTEWTRGKGAFKLYQYMAAGLPVVGSPVGLNREVVTPDVGVLASTPEAWVEALRQLARDADKRRSMGAAGRARAEQLYSRAVCVRQLAGVLERASHPTP